MRLTALTVIAETPTGFATDDLFSPALDGLVGFAFMRRKLGAAFGGGLSKDYRPVDGLPFAVIEDGDWWWYDVGLPEYEPVASRTQYRHKRFDEVAAERHLPSVRKAETRTGPFKNMRIPVRVILAPEIRWKAHGDAEQIEDLLSDLTHVGSGSTRGYGRVVRWRVEEGFAGRLRRPLPAAYADARGIVGRRIRWGVRPPYWLAANQTTCVVPE